MLPIIYKPEIPSKDYKVSDNIALTSLARAQILVGSVEDSLRMVLSLRNAGISSDREPLWNHEVGISIVNRETLVSDLKDKGLELIRRSADDCSALFATSSPGVFVTLFVSAANSLVHNLDDGLSKFIGAQVQVFEFTDSGVGISHYIDIVRSFSDNPTNKVHGWLSALEAQAGQLIDSHYGHYYPIHNAHLNPIIYETHVQENPVGLIDSLRMMERVNAMQVFTDDSTKYPDTISKAVLEAVPGAVACVTSDELRIFSTNGDRTFIVVRREQPDPFTSDDRMQYVMDRAVTAVSRVLKVSVYSSIEHTPELLIKVLFMALDKVARDYTKWYVHDNAEVLADRKRKEKIQELATGKITSTTASTVPEVDYTPSELMEDPACIAGDLENTDILDLPGSSVKDNPIPAPDPQDLHRPWWKIW